MMSSGKPSTGQPGKLQHNLNINVFALLPGARKPQKEAPLKRDILQPPHRSISLDSEDVRDGLPQIAVPSQGTGTVTNNENSTNSVQLLESITKTRPRGPVRRKPSTKRGREALRKSCTDFSFAKSLMTEDNVKDASSTNESHVKHVEPPKPRRLADFSHIENLRHMVLHQNVKETNQSNTLRAVSAKPFLRSHNQINMLNSEPETLSAPKFEVKRSETFHGRERSYFKKLPTSHGIERVLKTNDMGSSEPSPDNKFQKSERWDEFKPYRTEQRIFTSECTVQFSKNPMEIPKITLNRSADPAIKTFLKELITDRNSFDKATKDGITEIKTTTIFRRTTNSPNKASEPTTTKRRDFLNSIISQARNDETDNDSSLFTSTTRKIEKDKNGSEIKEETVTNYREESKADMPHNGKTVINTVTKTENIVRAKFGMSKNKPYDSVNENNLSSNPKDNIASSNLLLVDSGGPSDITRRSSFVKTDNFATPEFIKENLSEEEEEEDVFSEKKLPPQSDILKRSTLDDDDEELLVKEPKR